MAFWEKSSSPPPRDPEMKSIVYRGGVVTFRIPSHWREEYSDMEGGMFYDDRPDSGTLRLKIISMVAPEELQPDSALDLLRVLTDQPRFVGVDGTINARNDGNAVLEYEAAASEMGTPLTIFYWVVANPLPPRHARIATFSYTILEEQQNVSQIQRDVQMLRTEIEAAIFSPEIGTFAERSAK